MEAAIGAGNLYRSGIRRAILAVLFESDCPLSDTTTFSVASGAMGTFDEEGNYQPRQVIDDDLGMSFADAIEGTMVEVEDGQLVFGSSSRSTRTKCCSTSATRAKASSSPAS